MSTDTHHPLLLPIPEAAKAQQTPVEFAERWAKSKPGLTWSVESPSGAGPKSRSPMSGFPTPQRQLHIDLEEAPTRSEG